MLALPSAPMTTRSSLCSLLLAVVVACAPQGSPPPTAGAPSVTTSAAPPPAPASSALTTSADAGVSPQPLPRVNLLHHTDARVTLSSRVDNPRDYPEHLVDGKLGTAWNGKTSDLHAWIEVELDPRAYVEAIEITAGFDKDDLFEKNLRITKLAVERDGVKVREATLDPSRRGLQTIPIGGPGGKYRLTVVSTLPGTNPAWREVVVSELVVLGTAPPELVHEDVRLPRMTVAQGSARAPLPADLQDVTFEGREGAGGLLGICAAWKADVLAVVRKMQKAGMGLDGYDANGLVCSAEPAPPLENGPLPLGWALLSSVALRHFDGVVLRDDKYLLLRRPDGVTVAGPMYSTSNDVGDSPTPSAWRVGVVSSKGAPVLVSASAAAWHDRFDHSAAPDKLQVEYEGRLCRFELTRFTCDQPRPTLFAKKSLSKAEEAAWKANPRAELPTVDARTGQLLIAR